VSEWSAEGNERLLFNQSLESERRIRERGEGVFFWKTAHVTCRAASRYLDLDNTASSVLNLCDYCI
jgi:hypothetical protein